MRFFFFDSLAIHVPPQVPIVKLVDPVTSCMVDISLNVSTGLQSTEVVNQYIARYVCARVLLSSYPPKLLSTRSAPTFSPGVLSCGIRFWCSSSSSRRTDGTNPIGAASVPTPSLSCSSSCCRYTRAPPCHVRNGKQCAYACAGACLD